MYQIVGEPKIKIIIEIDIVKITGYQDKCCFIFCFVAIGQSKSIKSKIKAYTTNILL